MSKYFVNVEIRNGAYIEFGHKNTNIYKKTINAFVKYIQDEARFNVNSRLILNNMNYISFVYISCDYEDNTVVHTNDNDKPLFRGDIKWLEKEYPHIYNELLENKQAIIGYALISHKKENRDDYDTVDLIESRIKRNNIASLLLTEYTKVTNKLTIPESILINSESFWLSRYPFKGCTDDNQLMNAFKLGFKDCYLDFVMKNCSHLFDTISQHK